jgi:arsenite/tail-anchored protein-transporting ATPase
MFGDFGSNENSMLKGLFKDIGGMPGMDEIQSFLEIMKQVSSLKFSVVVFDTAPTGLIII